MTTRDITQSVKTDIKQLLYEKKLLTREYTQLTKQTNTSNKFKRKLLLKIIVKRLEEIEFQLQQLQQHEEKYQWDF